MFTFGRFGNTRDGFAVWLICPSEQMSRQISLRGFLSLESQAALNLEVEVGSPAKRQRRSLSPASTSRPPSGSSALTSSPSVEPPPSWSENASHVMSIGACVDMVQWLSEALEEPDSEGRNRAMKEKLAELRAGLFDVQGGILSAVPDSPGTPLSWAALPPSVMPSLAPLPSGMYPTRQYVFESVWSRFELLHAIHPHHPLFGPCELGAVRAPYRLTGGRGAATSWWLRVSSLADAVAKRMGPWIPAGSCWILDDQDTTIQRRRPDNTQETLKGYKHHRLLAFLRVGSPAAWSDFEAGAARPALHFCHNGFRGDRKSGCVNGIEHVWFGTASENNRQRACAQRSRNSCPGHGYPKHFCIFVHRDPVESKYLGWPKPCLNGTEAPPLSCHHAPSCV